MASSRMRTVWIFGALLVVAVLTSIVATLADVLVERALFDINIGGLVSCSYGFGGVTMSCTGWTLVQFAGAGVCAAAITTCALRNNLKGAGLQSLAGPGHVGLAIAASGPFVVLLFTNFALTGLFYLPTVLSHMTDLSYAVQFFARQAPYILAAFVGTAGFWGTPRTLSLHAGKRGRV